MRKNKHFAEYRKIYLPVFAKYRKICFYRFCRIPQNFPAKRHNKTQPNAKRLNTRQRSKRLTPNSYSCFLPPLILNIRKKRSKPSAVCGYFCYFATY